MATWVKAMPLTATSLTLPTVSLDGPRAPARAIPAPLATSQAPITLPVETAALLLLPSPPLPPPLPPLSSKVQPALLRQ